MTAVEFARRNIDPHERPELRGARGADAQEGGVRQDRTRRTTVATDKGRKLVIIKKKKVVGGGHHGGSWKVAYADFVTP
jgi:hypothetical protein